MNDNEENEDKPLIPQFIIDQGFNLKEQIGSGHFSKVFLATYNQMPETVIACKRIDITQVEEDWAENCLKQEMLIMKRLRHPHVVKVYQVFKTRTTAFIFMEFAENETIGKLLEKAKKPLKESQARIWFKQIMDGLNYMHSKGIAHRDLKLDNFLLNSQYEPLISDFGFACNTSDKSVNHIMRETVCGSLSYMAPEVHKASKENPYDAKAADIYSMGVCLFEMINYDKPFDGDLADTLRGLAKLIQLKLHRIYRYHKKIVPELSQEIKDLVDKLLEPDPENRVTAQEVCNDSALQSLQS